MAINVPLVHISDLTEQTTASDTSDYLVIGASDAKKIKWGTIWNLIKAKITGAASSILTSNLAVNKALVSDASGKVAAGGATSTELGYLSGAASNIQAQINTLNTKTGPTSLGSGVTYYKRGNDVTVAAAGNGSVEINSSWKTLATLPAGYRPPFSIIGAVDAGNGTRIAYMKVNTSGIVQVICYGGTTTWWDASATFPVA